MLNVNLSEILCVFSLVRALTLDRLIGSEILDLDLMRVKPRKVHIC